MSAIAILHPSTLIGKELRGRFDARPDLAPYVRLFSVDEDEVGTVTEVAGAAAFVNRWSEAVADEFDIAIFCGDLARDREARQILPPSTIALTLSPGATLEDGRPAIAGLCEEAWLSESRLFSPAAATILIARLLEPLAAVRPLAVSVTALLPVSEFGQEGIDELFAETRALLSFAKVKKSKHFPVQVAFNLFPGVLSGIEVERQLSAIFGEAAPACAVQTIQASLFHGVATSLNLRSEKLAGAAELRGLLARSDALRFARHPASMGTLDTAGADSILVGELRENRPGDWWLWATMDNLTTGAAANGVALAAALLGRGPAG